MFEVLSTTLSNCTALRLAELCDSDANCPLFSETCGAPLLCVFSGCASWLLPSRAVNRGLQFPDFTSPRQLVQAEASLEHRAEEEKADDKLSETSLGAPGLSEKLLSSAICVSMSVSSSSGLPAEQDFVSWCIPCELTRNSGTEPRVSGRGLVMPPPFACGEVFAGMQSAAAPRALQGPRWVRERQY